MRPQNPRAPRIGADSKVNASRSPFRSRLGPNGTASMRHERRTRTDPTVAFWLSGRARLAAEGWTAPPLRPPRTRPAAEQLGAQEDTRFGHLDGSGPADVASAGRVVGITSSLTDSRAESKRVPQTPSSPGRAAALGCTVGSVDLAGNSVRALDEAVLSRLRHAIAAQAGGEEEQLNGVLRMLGAKIPAANQVPLFGKAAAGQAPKPLRRV
jgi:hypothetical protein